MPNPHLIFEVFTLFPEVFEPYLAISILQRARQRGLIEIRLYNIRDWAFDRHHVTDDEPYGGGGGMVMKPEPIFAAVEAVLGSPPTAPVILLSPQGRLFTQARARELALGAETDDRAADLAKPPAPRRLGLICGRYEGIDERVCEHLVTDELSIGDYVITGGELAALVVIDAVSRWIPGVLGDPDGAWDDSHASGLIEYPQYTRPLEFRGWSVPEILRSGDHGRIARWRREQSLLRTWQRRPDLLEKAPLSEADRKFLEQIRREAE
ncbi:MAG: tRNA (guanosine(37)-N1)-methyltransferase TrmD [Anaerolineae bacterium UTCFX2]|jgi:tRNA (guanine37-N1)-methyltransferase|nr:tRNA (guanosine(37)-N1)-methyltransferase TrmD [Anaerolineales bacterium]OQY93385.1 MAG: tRNA (guanosine(37)-N1)-methyltransferase TrmD [Anaerolineae bacterium UTCFX2]